MKRDYNILLHIKGEINLGTRSETKRKPKFNRKEKHKNKG